MVINCLLTGGISVTTDISSCWSA